MFLVFLHCNHEKGMVSSAFLSTIVGVARHYEGIKSQKTIFLFMSFSLNSVLSQSLKAYNIVFFCPDLY